MKVFDMVHDVGNAAKDARPYRIWQSLIPKTDYTLGLLAGEGKIARPLDRIWSRRLFLDHIFVSWSQPRLTSLRLLSSGERRHEIDSKNLPSDDGLGAEVFRQTAENLL